MSSSKISVALYEKEQRKGNNEENAYEREG